MHAREAALRQAKAEKMAAVLIAHGADAATAAALDDEGRKLTAELAGTRPPSDKTWEVVTDCVRAHWHFYGAPSVDPDPAATYRAYGTPDPIYNPPIGPVSATTELADRIDSGRLLSDYAPACIACDSQDDDVALREVQRGHTAQLCTRCGEDAGVLRELADAP